MKIKLQNYDHLLNKKYLPDIQLIKLNNNLQITIDLKSIINSLNQSPILNDSSTKTLLIDFDNFTLFNKFLLNQKEYFKRKISKLFNTNYTTNDNVASYDFEQQKIFIREELFTHQHNEESFSKILKSSINNNDYINYAVLHEIGHAIHHQLHQANGKVLYSNQPYSDLINKTVYFHGNPNLLLDRVKENPNFNIEIYRGFDLNIMNYRAVTEGFADMYACVAISKIYPSAEAISLITEIINARKNADVKVKEFYCSHQSMENYLNDFKNSNVNLNSFKDIVEYISSIIEKSIISINQKQLQNITSDGHILNNRYLGLINSKLNLQCKNANDVINQLNKDYKVSYPAIQSLPIDFNIGEQLSDLHTNQIKNFQSKKSLLSIIKKMRNSGVESTNSHKI